LKESAPHSVIQNIRTEPERRVKLRSSEQSTVLVQTLTCGSHNLNQGHCFCHGQFLSCLRSTQFVILTCLLHIGCEPIHSGTDLYMVRGFAKVCLRHNFYPIHGGVRHRRWHTMGLLLHRYKPGCARIAGQGSSSWSTLDREESIPFGIKADHFSSAATSIQFVIPTNKNGNINMGLR
jgi:hypothetical protein